MAVQVRAGDDTRLDIALVQAASLSGTVAMAPASLRNLLVSFRKDGIGFNRLTDENGNFRLGSIAPGQWTVSIDPTTVPDGYLLEQEQLVAELAPGARAVLAFRLKIKVRAIRMQQLTPVENQVACTRRCAVARAPVTP